MEIHGWKLYYHRLFQQLLNELEQEVVRLKEKDPQGYISHPQCKLLAAIYNCILKEIPKNPNDRQFFLGKTLGEKYTSWRRIKKPFLPGQSGRYRLFFRFSSETKEIFYVWFNDETTLRKAGAKTDVYAVFEKMLDRKLIPSDLSLLRKESTSSKIQKETKTGDAERGK